MNKTKDLDQQIEFLTKEVDRLTRERETLLSELNIQISQKEKFRCSICGKNVVSEVHNTNPIVSLNGSRCCDKCYREIVVPTLSAVIHKECELRLRLENKKLKEGEKNE